MKIINFLLASGFVVYAFAGCQQDAVQEKDKEKPNIIVILTDDQRYDYLGCTGNEFIQTPNIDGLAEKGILFSQAYMTSPLCMPSRANLFTGQYTRYHSVDFSSNTAMAGESWMQTYPMLLKQNGYHVGYLGKNHVPVGPNGWFDDYMKNTFDYWYGNQDQPKFYPKDEFKQYHNARANTQIEILDEGMQNFLGQNDCFAGADSFLRETPGDKPFLLCVNFNVPHSAGTGTMEQRLTDPQLYRTAYRDKKDNLPMVENYIETNGAPPLLPKELLPDDYGYKDYDYTKQKETMQEQMVRVMQTISGVDQFVGNLVAKLKEKGILENTIIIFTSDHGIFFGENGLRGKTFLYDNGMHVPLIIFDPGLPSNRKGQKIKEFALGVDIAPTILDAAGIAVPDFMQGKSLIPLMRGEKIEWRQDFFCENNMVWQKYPRMEGVRSKKWKYIRYFENVSSDIPFADRLEASIKGEKPIYEELFDLENDPLEANNLSDDPDYKEKLEKMRSRCRELVKQWRTENPPETHEFKVWEMKWDGEKYVERKL